MLVYTNRHLVDGLGVWAVRHGVWRLHSSGVFVACAQNGLDGAGEGEGAPEI